MRTAIHSRAIQACAKDPLAKLLINLNSYGNFFVTLIVLLIYSVLCFGIGFGISYYYSRQGIQILEIYRPSELIFALFVYIIIRPAIWTYYAWQPVKLITIFESLIQNKIINEKDKNLVNIFVNENIIEKGNKLIYPVLIFTITISGIVFWISTLTPANPFNFGAPSVWWQINIYYFHIIWIPLIFVNIYMLLWFAIRLITLIQGLGNFYS